MGVTPLVDGDGDAVERCCIVWEWVERIGVGADVGGGGTGVHDDRRLSEAEADVTARELERVVGLRDCCNSGCVGQ